MNRTTLQRKLKHWQQLRTTKDLAALLSVHESELQLQALNPLYKVFQIPKANGKFRTIEDPNPRLKRIQRKMNEYLQWSYYTMRPASSYGFSISLPNDDEPRTIITNAKRHIGKTCLLNMDMQDFFYQIKDSHIEEHFLKHYPTFDNDLLDLFGKICTYKNRLPMGAPTSPVISNICVIPLDDELHALCQSMNITYTRFVDDMSFSTNEQISEMDIKLLKETILSHGFELNPAKTKLCNNTDLKMVTGIVVTHDTIELPTTYLPLLKKEIARLKAIKETEYRYRTGMNYKRIQLFEQEVMGKLNFAQQVVTDENPDVMNLLLEFEEALQSPDDFESVDWLEIPYF